MENAPNTPSNKKASTCLQLCFGGFSAAGAKPENQDAFAALIPKNSELIAKGAVAALADGVSSASKAADASQLAVTQFINEFYATPETWSTEKSAGKVLNSLNQWLYQQNASGEESQHGYSQDNWLTTFTALILKSATGYIFHVGDSRLSLYSQQKLEPITRDHNRRQGNKHVVLTRAMGADTRVEVDIHKVNLKVNDIFIITCDGVHDFLSAKEISEHLDKVERPFNKQNLEQTSHQITSHAINNGSDDNVSCLLVGIDQIPNRKLEEIERDLLQRTIPPALKVGDRIDEYTVRKIIHASIRSHLYLVDKSTSAEPEVPPKLYVLKTPSENFSDDSIYLQGFMREAWVGERINHENVMKITNAKSDSKFLYHVCEYVEGQTLDGWCQENPKPQIAQVREIVQQIVSALRAFQRLELVHRDLKLDNIMIDAFGQVKLIDYGTVSVASLDENQETITESVPQGSLNYIAPETLLYMQSNNQSDLFSLGVICYQMLCGELPYKPMKRAEVTFSEYSQWQYRSIKQFRPEIPLWLDLTLKQATSADPKSRYNAFSEFFSDLSKPNLTAVEEYKTQPLLQRNPILFWQGMSFFLFIALVISLIW